MSADRLKREAQLAQMAEHYQRKGYEDGLYGLPAKSLNADYQAGWRKGHAEHRAKT